MFGDAYRELSHDEMQARLYRTWAPIADFIKTEHSLPGGRIADIYMRMCGATIITEVKSELKMSLLDVTIDKYYEHCDFLIYACPPQAQIIVDTAPILNWQNIRRSKPGILFVDWQSITWMRQPLPKQNSRIQLNI